MYSLPSSAIEPSLGAIGIILFGWGLWRDYVESKRLGLARSRERWLIVRLVRWIRRPTGGLTFTTTLIVLGWSTLLFVLATS